MWFCCKCFALNLERLNASTGNFRRAGYGRLESLEGLLDLSPATRGSDFAQVGSTLLN